MLLTGLFVRSDGSVLLPTLLHAAANGSTPLTGRIDAVSAWELRAIVYAVLAVALLVVAREEFLRRPRTDNAADVRAAVGAERRVP